MGDQSPCPPKLPLTEGAWRAPDSGPWKPQGSTALDLKGLHCFPPSPTGGFSGAAAHLRVHYPSGKIWSDPQQGIQLSQGFSFQTHRGSSRHRLSRHRGSSILPGCLHVSYKRVPELPLGCWSRDPPTRMPEYGGH